LPSLHGKPSWVDQNAFGKPTGSTFCTFRQLT
jgi:hypothetical protein